MAPKNRHQSDAGTPQPDLTTQDMTRLTPQRRRVRRRRQQLPIDVLIVTALQEERDALLGLLPGARQVQRPGSPTYYTASLQAPGRLRRPRIAVMMLTGMGNVIAAQQTTRALDDLAPAYLLMVGIAGGVRGRVRLGDVLIADQVLYYESAKVTPAGLDPRPHSYMADPHLLDRALNFTDPAWHSLIRAVRPGQRHTSQIALPRPVVGVVAAGEKVVADEVFAGQVRRIHTKVVGFEMESFGVALAAAHHRQRPRFLAIRGVSDYADPHKHDRWHAYAAASAAAFTIALLGTGAVSSS